MSSIIFDNKTEIELDAKKDTADVTCEAVNFVNVSLQKKISLLIYIENKLKEENSH